MIILASHAILICLVTIITLHWRLGSNDCFSMLGSIVFIKWDAMLIRLTAITDSHSLAWMEAVVGSINYLSLPLAKQLWDELFTDVILALVCEELAIMG